ncbi:alkylphosphocholine resistance protein lem3 [Tieghemiomyces parasiticus]|uniref:Alkylphosphocholine resistance protein lem3 n=2 Tax=Tieghemiomyces parasiticus TaxID=78921 RepID=A0A9W7ZMH1_9FUNG|nr:alkylphosphocholine resistance protein lem3 [Tieghemiomyces parasiticus]
MSPNKEETKSKKPANTAFKQQRLKAWQPLLTPKTVLPTFFAVGIIFAPLGGVLLWASDSVNEIIIDYTACSKAGSTFVSIPANDYSVRVSGSSSGQMEQIPQFKYEDNQCTLQFSLPADLKPPVFLYYKLTNFYQNHRRYVKSLDYDQLRGKSVSASTLNSSSNSGCPPLATMNVNGTSKIIFPCGLIANSIFNDTLGDPVLQNPADTTAESVLYPFSPNGIAWPSDKQNYAKTTYNLNDIVAPPNWWSKYPGGAYTSDNPPPDLSTDERFQVWMRTAGLPNFRKLYGRNEGTTMKSGIYEMVIQDNYDVSSFDGTKSIVISTVSFMGGKNPFLGIAYIVVGVLCVVLGCLFTARHIYRPRKLGDHTYLSWNQQVASGLASQEAPGAAGH